MNPEDHFEDHGTHFPLYHAPMSTVSGLKTDEMCDICNRNQPFLFTMRQNDFILDPCEKCGQLAGLRIGRPNQSPEPAACANCGTTRHWPHERPRHELLVCYECLNNGRAAVAHETGLGHIKYEHTLRGMAATGNPNAAACGNGSRKKPAGRMCIAA